MWRIGTLHYTLRCNIILCDIVYITPEPSIMVHFGWVLVVLLAHSSCNYVIMFHVLPQDVIHTTRLLSM
jgi:hypothetical protein